MDYQIERNLALEAAHLTASLCLAVQRDMLGTPERMDKAGREPVTIADFGAQAIICALLLEHLPADRILAEESAADFDALAGSGQRQQVTHHVSEALGRPVTTDDVRRWLDHGRDASSSRVWMIDPIDGTKGFLRGEQFAVAIGLAVDNVLTVGALACPKFPLHADSADEEVGLVLSAVRGQGATAEPLAGGDAWPLNVSATTQPAEARAVRSVEAAHNDPTAVNETLAALGVTQAALRMDSQAKYAAVADGRAEVYLRTMSSPDYRERVWDHAAGALIVSEAGGTVTDLYGQPLDFSRQPRLEDNRGVLATNSHLHAATLDALRQAGVTGAAD
jgi:3'(2'), 5'-bisphosphate nucleotidase